MQRYFSTTALAMMVIAPIVAEGSSIDYTVVALPVSLVPVAINNSGVIAGSVDYSQGFVAQPGGLVTLIGNLPGGNPARVTGINNSGQVVGYGQCNLTSCGFTYSNGVTQTIIAGRLSASAINDAGTVAGSVSTITPQYVYTTQGFTYANGQIQDLGTLPGFIGSTANGINNAGQVVGDLIDANGESHAFLETNGTMQDLGTLPGDLYSEATGINNLGEVIGDSDGMYDQQSFVYNPATGVMTALGGSDVAESPTSINDIGQIVGIEGPGVGNAFLYSDGSFYNLNDLIPSDSGWVLQSAYSINDSGQIVGMGLYDGVREGFVLTQTPYTPPYFPIVPTPEPNALLVCLGTCVLIAIGNRVRGTARRRSL